MELIAHLNLASLIYLDHFFYTAHISFAGAYF